MKITVTLDHDHDCGNPLTENDGMWTLHSFGRRHRNFKQPEELGLGAMTEDGPIVRNPGLRRKLQVGLAFFLSYYEHSICVWSLKGEGPHCRWDSVRYAGLLIWNNKPSDMGAKTYEARQEDARSCLKEYTAWCNGECYCFCIEDENGKHIHSCGGFIGPDLQYMFDEITGHIPKGAEVEFEGDAAYLSLLLMLKKERLIAKGA